MPKSAKRPCTLQPVLSAFMKAAISNMVVLKAIFGFTQAYVQTNEHYRQVFTVFVQNFSTLTKYMLFNAYICSDLYQYLSNFIKKSRKNSHEYRRQS